MNIGERGLQALNLSQYSHENKPEEVGEINVLPPKGQQYILRCLIKEPFSDFQVPKEMEWCNPIIEHAQRYQESIGIRQPFCYLTIRSGEVESQNDDQWHVDGFSQTITHLPEQNYVWANNKPTEFIVQGIDIPKNFDPSIHNIHFLIHDLMNPETVIQSCKNKVLYCMDPYVIHRRPLILSEIKRTFIRVSFTPIEIVDRNNTPNPHIPRNYDRDGVNDFRDKLTRYPVT